MAGGGLGDLVGLGADLPLGARRPGRGGLRFAFYGRVSAEDWQDPVTSRARQRDQAAAPGLYDRLVACVIRLISVKDDRPPLAMPVYRPSSESGVRR